MTRQPEAGKAAAPPAPPAPHVIDPNAVYTVPTAAAALGLARETLPREIRLGRLQARKRGGRHFILGQWLLDWVSTGEPHHAWGAAHGGNGDGAR
jgi:hypothetical protein